MIGRQRWAGRERSLVSLVKSPGAARQHRPNLGIHVRVEPGLDGICQVMEPERQDEVDGQGDLDDR